MILFLIIGSVINQSIALLGSLLCFRIDNKWLPNFVKSLLFLSWILISVVIFFSWMNEQRPPFKTLHESLILLSWCIGFVGLLSFFNGRHPFVWLLVSITSVVALLYAMFNPDIEKIFLPPALQSVWFIPHVVVYFIGYSALIIGSLLLMSFPHIKKVLCKLKYKGVYDKNDLKILGSKILRIGFLFLTMGLILGAIWADEAWGTYWGWDPKESWALITFLVYGGFLHFTEKTQDSKTGKIILAVGIFTILFTYLGIESLPTAENSMHMYK